VDVGQNRINTFISFSGVFSFLGTNEETSPQSYSLFSRHKSRLAGRDDCPKEMGLTRCFQGREKHQCAKCNPCPHGKVKRDCVACNPCFHGKLKKNCKDCTPCPHGKLKDSCAACNPCPHSKRKRDCAKCNERRGNLSCENKTKTIQRDCRRHRRYARLSRMVLFNPFDVLLRIANLACSLQHVVKVGDVEENHVNRG
jgi:hypothetical protein